MHPLIEPSAGDGRFSKYVAFDKMYDISPFDNTNTKTPHINTKSIIKQDFLTTTDQNAHYLGNPPFGNVANLANKFIKHCCSNNAQSISFILPRSFRKESMKKVFNEYYHLVFEYDYDQFETVLYQQKNVPIPCSFQKKIIPCVFQIWIKRDYKRPTVIKQMTNQYFQFVNPKSVQDDVESSVKNSDVETTNSTSLYNIRRVGITAGQLNKGKDVAQSSHYFIRFNDNVDVEEFIKEYSKIKFVCDKNTGQKSLSKPELNAYLEQIDQKKVLKIDVYQFYDPQIVKQFSDEELKLAYTSSKNYLERCSSLYNALLSLNPQLNISLTQLQQSTQIQDLLIQPQSKASIRGNKFNEYVYQLCKSKYQNVFKEQKIQTLDEIVDCVVSYNNQTMYLYNQIDLFNGGEQLNRASKYLSLNRASKYLSLNRASKYLSLNRDDVLLVILDKPKSKNGKAQEFLLKGVQEQKICFVGGLLQMLDQKFNTQSK